MRLGLRPIRCSGGRAFDLDEEDEAQGQTRSAVCGSPLAHWRGRTSRGHVVDDPRDASVGRPEGLANEGTKTGRGRQSGGLRRSWLDWPDRRQAPSGQPSLREAPRQEAIICEVRVFLFRVERQIDEWPEKGSRECKWFDAKEAAALVEEGGLAEILDRFSGSYVRFVPQRRGRSRYARQHLPTALSVSQP